VIVASWGGAVLDAQNIAPEFMGPHSIASVLFAEILAYRTDAFDAEPTGWADFWDAEQFPGAAPCRPLPSFPSWKRP
jgi:spermidine/putrescine-binding protein